MLKASLQPSGLTPIVQVKESSPSNMLYVGADWKVLVKNNTNHLTVISASKVMPSNVATWRENVSLRCLSPNTITSVWSKFSRRKLEDILDFLQIACPIPMYIYIFFHTNIFFQTFSKLIIIFKLGIIPFLVRRKLPFLYGRKVQFNKLMNEGFI